MADFGYEAREYPNARDCEHGRRRGKCADCDVAALRTKLAKAREIADKIKRQGDEIAAHELVRQEKMSELLALLEES